MKCPVCNGTGKVDNLRANLRHMIEHGIKYRVIADKFGFRSASTVHYWAKKWGITRHVKTEDATS